MRLLSFLTSLESNLRDAGQLEGNDPCSRFVDYGRGTARMCIDDNLAVTLTLYRLASGRSCMRVNLERSDKLLSVRTLYPESDAFSWSAAAYEVGEALQPLLRREPVEVPAAANVVNG